jgi:hypothetical protein
MSTQYTLKHSEGFIHYTYTHTPGGGVGSVSTLEEATIFTPEVKEQYNEFLLFWSERKGYSDMKWEPVDVELLSKRSMD